MKIARLLLRLVIGGLFVGHGTQKLFGWFGGHGLEGTAQFFENLGMRPGRLNAQIAGIAEAGGGAALATGLATPVAAAALTATMLTAIYRVHWKSGPWVTNGGYEYNLVLIAAVLLLVEAGPGTLSLDAALGGERCGPAWTLLAALLGAGGAAAVNVRADAQAAPADPPAGDPAAA